MPFQFFLAQYLCIIKFFCTDCDRFQILQHFPGRLITVFRLLCHRLTDNRGTFIGNTRIHIAGIKNVSMTMGIHDLHNAASIFIGMIACQQCVIRSPQRIDITPHIDRFGFTLFGTHEVRRPDQLAILSQLHRLLNDAFRQTKISNLDRAMCRLQQISRLDITMYQSGGMRHHQTFTGIRDNV